jgi:hypothetical protein
MRQLAALALLAPVCIAMCPPCHRDPEQIKIVDAQRVVVFHRAGMEDLILQSAYKGKAGDFGMILPLPDVPEIRMANDKFCDALAELAQERDVRRFGEDSARMQKAEAGAAPPIEVVKRQIAGVFEAVTLKARKLDALQKWLKDHEYRYVDDAFASKVFQGYIDKEWLFVAVRVTLEKNAEFDGSFRPMGLRFKTRDIVIPTKVASIYPTGMPFAIYVLTNSAVDFPKAWGKGRVVTMAVTAEQILASAPLRAELADDAVMDRSGAMKKLADGLSAEKKDEFLKRKLSGLYLSKFAGHFSREQLAAGDLVFERDNLLDAKRVDELVADLKGDDLAKVKSARAVLAAAGATHVATLAKHLAAATDAQHRIAFAKVLAVIGELEAVPALIDALEKEDDRLAKMAVGDALTELTGHAEKDWRAWWEKNKP